MSPGTAHSRRLLLSLAALLLFCQSIAFAEGWRYPDESCQWTVKGTAKEAWSSTETEYTRSGADAHAFADAPGWNDPVFLDTDTATATATARGNVQWSISFDVSSYCYARATVDAAGQHVERELVGGDLGDRAHYSGQIPVSSSDTVVVFALAEIRKDPWGYVDPFGYVDVYVTAYVPSRVYPVAQLTTETASSGPHQGTVNKGEGIKTMGTFPLSFSPQHGGTLSPTTYTLINVTPPAHGLIWIDPANATVFAETSFQIRTWDLLVRSKNLRFPAAIGARPADNNLNTTGTTPFSRVYDTGESVILTAPACTECRAFNHWEYSTSQPVGSNPILTFTMDCDKIYTAVYNTWLSAPALTSEPAFTPGTLNQIAWSAVAGSQGYLLQWSKSSSFSVLEGNSGWRPGAAFGVGGLADGQTYYYRVRCRNAALEESGWSNVVSSQQDATGPTAPGIPADDGEFTSLTLIRFRWTPATDSGSGVANYGLYVGTTPGGNDLYNGMVGNVLERTVGARNGQTVYARVYARDAVGLNGLWSAPSNGITVDTDRPRLTSLMAINDVTLEITFDEPVRNADRAASYSCSGSVAILHTLRLSETRYRLYTTTQRPGQSYTLTVRSDVVDRAGNSIHPSYSSRSFAGGARLTPVPHWRHYH